MRKLRFALILLGLPLAVLGFGVVDSIASGSLDWKVVYRFLGVEWRLPDIVEGGVGMICAILAPLLGLGSLVAWILAIFNIDGMFSEKAVEKAVGD